MKVLKTDYVKEYCSCLRLSLPRKEYVAVQEKIKLKEIELEDRYGLPVFVFDSRFEKGFIHLDFILRKRKRKDNFYIVFEFHNFVPKVVELPKGYNSNDYKKTYKSAEDILKKYITEASRTATLTIDAKYEYPTNEFYSVLRLPYAEPLNLNTVPLGIGLPNLIGLEFEFSNSALGLNLFQQSVSAGKIINMVSINYESKLEKGIEIFFEAFLNAKEISELFIGKGKGNGK